MEHERNYLSDAQLQELTKGLYVDIGPLNQGGCGVLTRIMNEIFETNSFLYVIDEEELENDPPIHVMVEIRKGVFFDADGIQSLQDIKEAYCDEERFFLLQDNEDILNVRYNEWGEGLFVMDYKEDYDKIKEYIFKYLKITRNDKAFLKHK